MIYRALFVILFGALSTMVSAHGFTQAPEAAPPDYVPSEERLLTGGQKFADSMLRESSGVLTSEQVHALSDIRQLYTLAEQVGMGWFLDYTETNERYQQDLADTAMLEFLKTATPDLVLDSSSASGMPSPEAIIDFDFRSETLLIKVGVSDGTGHLRVQHADFQRERYASPYNIDVADSGTTWVLLHMDGVPRGRSTTAVSFTREGENAPFLWHALSFDLPPLGALRLQLLDENEAPCPALVHIANAETGGFWPIQAAHDFSTLIHDVHGPVDLMPPGLHMEGPNGSLLVHYVGRPSRVYWLVDSGTEVSLPPGEWRIEVMRGLEYQEQQQTVTVESGEWTQLEFKASRWEDMKSRGWYSGDDHVHSQLMHSGHAETLLALGRAMDLHVQNILEMGDPQRTYYHQRGFGDSFHVRDGDYWLVPGQEDPRSMLGHNIGMNLKRMVRDRNAYLDLGKVAKGIHDDGGLFGQTHVGQNMCFAHRGMAMMMPHEIYDFVSVMQVGLGTDLYYDFLNLGYRIPASAGSDMPFRGISGESVVYVHCGEGNFSPDKWFDGLKAGRSFATNGPMIELRVNGKLPGAVIGATQGESLDVAAEIRGSRGGAPAGSLQLIVNGEVAQSIIEASDSGSITLSEDITLEDAGFWIAARGWGSDGTAAHTSPIYVQTKDGNHWNREKASEVVERQLAVLDEIEGELRKVEKMQSTTGINPLDFGNLGIYRERGRVREVLAESRALYRERLELILDD